MRRESDLKARKHSTVVLKLIDEALYQMAFSVQVFVVVARRLPIRLGWNDGLRCLCFNLFNEGVRVVSLVGNHELASQAFDQGRSLSDIVALACC